jgi:putative sigma-54 modulation protein
MESQITFRHSKATESLKQVIQDDLDKLERFFDNITSARVVLDTDSINKKAEIVLNLYSHTVTATSKAENIGKAWDAVIGKAERQLKKINEKMKNHKHQKTIAEDR